MITGVVRSRAARIELTIRGPGGHEEEIEAVVDTGFNGSLTLPSSLVKLLGLPWQNVVRGTLAVESESDALVGMELLDGFELKVQVRPRGKVTIKRMS